MLINKGGVYTQRVANPQRVQITLEGMAKKYGVRRNQGGCSRKKKILDRENCMCSRQETLSSDT